MRPLGTSKSGTSGGLKLAPGSARPPRALALSATLACALALAGCGSISEFVAERGSELPGVGVPDNAPARPVARAAYPAVHDMPPPRDSRLLGEDEQRKIEDDLLAARARNQRAGGQPVTPAPEPAQAKSSKSAPAKPAPVRRPTSSGGSIY